MTRPPRRDASARSAFTLLEVAIVGVMLAVLAASTVPALAAILGRESMMQSRGDLVAFLASQRDKAIAQGNVRWVRWEGGGHHIIAGVDAQPIDDELALPAEVELTENGYERLDDRFFETVDPSLADAGWSSEIVFLPDGSATQATIELVIGSRARTVTVHQWSGVIE